MEPTTPAAPSITSFFDKAKTISNSQLLKNANKLSDNQVALAIKIIQNTDNIIGTYEEGQDPKLEQKLNTIITILSGERNPSLATRMKSAIKSLFQSKEKAAEQIAERQSLVYSLPFKTTFVFQDKTTKELLQDLAGDILTTDEQLTRQLYRDYSALSQKTAQPDGSLSTRVKVDGTPLNLVRPDAQPANWAALIPDEMRAFIGNDETMAKNLALLMTQGITRDPESKGAELIRDPLAPNAIFKSHNDYPYFELSKVNDEIILTVTNKGFLSTFYEDGTKANLKDYDMSQVINLTNPDTPVKMTIKPVPTDDDALIQNS